MNADDDRKILALVRGIDIERLPLIAGVGVGRSRRTFGWSAGSDGARKRERRAVMGLMVVPRLTALVSSR
jgi:hypothetical protein